MSKETLRYRIGILATGFLVDRLTVFVFDGLLYTVVLDWYRNHFGRLQGGILGLCTMTVLSYLICRLFMIFYDWAKIDWLMTETIKETSGEGSKWETRLRFLFLSLGTDPFITMISLRRGAHLYNGMSPRDWRIFLGSLVISNAFWAVVVLTALEKFEGSLAKPLLLMALLAFVAPVIRARLTKHV